jgi:DNA repair protein RadD
MDSSEDLSLAALATVTASAVSTDALPIELRDYQSDCISRLRHCYAAGHRAPLLCLPTAAGKTVVFAAISYSARRKGKKILVCVHRRELLRQAVAKLAWAGLTCGIISPDEAPDYDQQVQVGSIQTLVRRLDKLPEFDLLIFDECHHCRAAQWANLIAAQPKAFLLGVTATPARLDGKGLGRSAGGCFDALVIGPEVTELTDQGFLSPAHCFVPDQRLNLRGVKTVAGDYDRRGLEQVVDAKIIGDAVGNYRKHADHQAAIAYCISIKHAQATAQAFRDEGYRSVALSGKTPVAKRDAAIAGLADGSIEVLCSCDLISEGLDVPVLGAVILLRPTKSLVLHKQQVGRGLRPSPGKVLVVLDHVSNCLTHGLPDSVVPWSLDGVEKKNPAPTWRCPECGCLNEMAVWECVECGSDRPQCAGGGGKPRTITAAAGELAELTAEHLAQLRSVRMEEYCAVPRTEAELTQYANARGFKRGWVWHQLRKQAEIPPWALQDLPTP